MKYFFIAGERSGDHHAAKVIQTLRELNPNAEIMGWGGEQMQEAGAQIFTFYHSISFMGFWEVARNLHILKRHLSDCKRDIDRERPDVLVLIDFPGFNLRMATYAKSLGIKTCYYISPKLWAWKKNRIKIIRKSVDRMLVILPFEVDFYKNYNFSVTYVGNPSVEDVRNHRPDERVVLKLKRQGKNIAFLPGSRVQEIKSAIEVVIQLSDTYDDYQFLVAAVDNVSEELYLPLRSVSNVKVLYNKTYEILKASEVAVVTSGTASLETALLGVPQVVIYRTSLITYWLARLLVKVKYISLVNLIAGKWVVKELIQGDYDAADIATELEHLLNDDSTKKRISEGYSEIQKLIGTRSASQNAAEAIVALSSS